MQCMYWYMYLMVVLFWPTTYVKHSYFGCYWDLNGNSRNQPWSPLCTLHTAQVHSAHCSVLTVGRDNHEAPPFPDDRSTFIRSFFVSLKWVTATLLYVLGWFGVMFIPRPAGVWLVTCHAGGGQKAPSLRSPKLLDRFPNFKRHWIAL